MYGYRTTMSMKNKETWKYAHRCCGKLWYVSGLVMLLPTVIALVCVFGKGNDYVGTIGGIVCMAQCIPMVGAIALTELELKRDSTGMEECEEIEERGVQRDHPPAPEKTFRGRWMISDRKRTDLRRAAAVIHDNRMLAERAFYCCYKKEPEQKPFFGFCSGSFLQEHPCFAGLSFSSSP